MNTYIKNLVYIWCVRLMLTLVGIIVSLVAFEFCLAVFSSFVLNRANEDVSDLGGQRRIVIATIGESTSARLGADPPWPVLLEQELNIRLGTGSAHVVNLAQAGSQTDLLTKRLIRDVPLIKPDIVISMMGINDDVVYGATDTDSVIGRLRHSRVVRFFSILVRMATGGEARRLLLAAQQCEGSSSFGQKEWNESIESRITSRQSGETLDLPLDPLIIPVIENFIYKYPFAYTAYDVLVHNLPYEDVRAVPTKWEDTLFWADRFLEVEPFIKLCIRKSPLMSDGERLNRLMSVASRHDAIADIRDLAHRNVQAQKKGEKFQEIDEKRAKKALGVIENVHTVDTATNYRKVAKFLAQNNIHYIAMQYPLISISSIKDMLQGVDGVIYIDNENNFYDALTTYTYEDLFVDNFAGVFGHTTLLGSSFIASRAADTVIKIIRDEELLP